MKRGTRFERTWDAVGAPRVMGLMKREKRIVVVTLESMLEWTRSLLTEDRKCS